MPLKLLEGKYEIVRKLGEGGMGEVYMARHTFLEELRVIKVLRPYVHQDEAAKARFLREAKLAAKLKHPNIAQLFDFNMDPEGNAFLVMEYVPGLGLDELLRRHGALPVPVVLHVVVKLLSALGYMHRRGMVHRDVSPDNVMVFQDEEGGLGTKLIDLGLAKTLEDEATVTVSGTFLGKVRYAAPEQFKGGTNRYSPASDLYSLGVVMYELLTGKHPMKGSTIAEFIAAHIYEPPAPFDATDPDGRVPANLRRIVLKALEKAPEDRYGSAEEMMADLEPLVNRHFLDPVAVASLFEVKTEPVAMPREPSREELVMQLISGATKAQKEKKFDEAARLLEEALKVAPEDQLLRQVYEDMKAEWEEHVRREEAISRAVAEIKGLLAAGEAQAAWDLLERAISEHGSHDLLEGLRPAVRKKLEEKRMEAEVVGTAESIAAVIAQGDLVEAERRLDIALKVYGRRPELEGLRGEIQRLRSRRSGGATELLRRAEQLERAGELMEALECLEKARRVNPADPAVERSYWKISRKVTVSAIRERLDAGDVEEAERRLRDAEERFGRTGIFLELRKKLEDAKE